MDADVEALIHLNDSLKYLRKLKVSISSLFQNLASGKWVRLGVSIRLFYFNFYF